MRKINFCILVLVLCWPLSARPFSRIPEGATETMLNEALQGQTMIFNRRYQEAEQHFLRLAQKYPDSALGSFGLMANLNAHMFENFDFALDKNFEEEQLRNKAIVDKIAKNENATAFDDFLCGASSGLRGFYYSRKDKLFAALGEANQAKKCLERAQQRDPQFYDVNIGFGLFNFWRSVFTSRFKFLPLFKDNRALGISQIQTAIDQGLFANDLARASLAFVYFEQNNSKAGLPLVEKLLETYPQNIIMKNLKGYFLSMSGQKDAAVAVFDEVLKTAPEINVARYYKGLTYFRSHENKLAEANLRDFLDHKPPPAWQAYAQYLLGVMALNEGRRDEAWDHFKAGTHVYGDYSANLKMILQMRKGEK